MSKKLFNALAQAFANVRPDDEESDAYFQWFWDMKTVAVVYKKMIKSFDYYGFKRACRTLESE